MTSSNRDTPTWLDVSRETLERLIELEALVLKWTPAVNLISKSSAPEIWSRHILDSAQIGVLVAADWTDWVDLGSGGGFPALVLAVMAKDRRRNQRFTLVESDGRKAAFLREAVRALDLPALVITNRIEMLPALNADVLSARALAPLSDLLAHANQHLRPGGRALFPKGSGYRDEIHQATRRWRFSVTPHISRTDPEAAILEITEIELR